jgi:predicted nucleic acid-binding protein
VITYVDTSVLLRIVLGEDAPVVSWDQMDPVSSELIRVEALRAVERYRLLNAMDDELVAERRAAILDTLGRFTMSSITPSILERAGDPFPTALATLDAIHLATALVLRDEFPEAVFATHDQKLATGARALGFVVEGA